VSLKRPLIFIRLYGVISNHHYENLKSYRMILLNKSPVLGMLINSYIHSYIKLIHSIKCKAQAINIMVFSTWKCVLFVEQWVQSGTDTAIQLHESADISNCARF
jgi:hypothetical protein